MALSRTALSPLPMECKTELGLVPHNHLQLFAAHASSEFFLTLRAFLATLILSTARETMALALSHIWSGVAPSMDFPAQVIALQLMSAWHREKAAAKAKARTREGIFMAPDFRKCQRPGCRVVMGLGGATGVIPSAIGGARLKKAKGTVEQTGTSMNSNRARCTRPEARPPRIRNQYGGLPSYTPFSELLPHAESPLTSIPKNPFGGGPT